MVKISKVLNNNAVIIKDQGQEKIDMGMSVSYEKVKNEIVNQEKIGKLIVLNEKEKVQQKIAMGMGVGFEKGKNDIVNQEKIEKLFVLNENEKLQQLLERIPEEHLSLTEEIIRHAEMYLDVQLGDHILLALTDHISF